MQTTNIHNIPETIYDSMMQVAGEYSKGDAEFSITGLLDSPRIRILRQRYFAEIEEDITGRFKSWIGSVMHKHLAEKDAKRSNLISSGAIFLDINGFKIKGESDLYDANDCSITDYKFTSVYSVIYSSKDDSFEEQLNGYAMLFRSLGFEVKSLKICYFLTDHSMRKAALDPDYPQSPIMTKEFKLWTPEECNQFFSMRIYAHKSAQGLDDELLPECSPEERWQSEPGFAVMKEGNKKATKVFPTEEQATTFIAETKTKNASDKKKSQDVYSVQVRPAEAIRCKLYCPVNKFCNTYMQERERLNAGR